MANGKRDLSDSAILSLLLGGTSASDLTKRTKVTQRDIARALLTNPDVFAQLQGSATSAGRKYEKYDPSRYYYDAKLVEQSNVNPITERWRSLAGSDPASALLAQEYFKTVLGEGNNPSLQQAIRDKAQEFAVGGLGMDSAVASGLLDALEEDRDKFFTEELNRRRNLEEANYKAFQRGREDLKLAEGESATEAIFGKATGLGGLAKAPSPKLSFKEQAAQLATERYVPQAKGRSADVAERIALPQAGNVAAFEKAFLGELKKRGKEKSSPFKEAVKKLLPSMLTKKELGL